MDVYYTHADRLYLYGKAENICSVASRKYIIYMNVHDKAYRIYLLEMPWNGSGTLTEHRQSERYCDTLLL